MVGDDEVVRRQRVRFPIQRWERLGPLAWRTTIPPSSFAEIERVKRLAEVVKNIVGDVHDDVDRTQADGFEFSP